MEPILVDGKQFDDHASIEEAFQKGQLSEQSLKAFLKGFLNRVLEKVQRECDDEKMAEIIRKGYPKEVVLVPQADSRSEVVEDCIPCGMKVGVSQTRT